MANQQLLPTKKFASAKAWQTWLAKNYSKSNGVWLMFAKKNADKQTVTYAEALNVALCHGWIDGQKQSHDEQYWMQKFVPRQAKSIWSKKNIEHTERLIKEGKMQPAGLKAIEAAKANAFFKTLNRTNLFSIVFRLQTAKKEETRQKRIAKIIEMLEREEKFH